MYPVALGHPNYSQSGASMFIPELWSGKILVKFYASTVFGEIANTDYEGEIKNYGDKVVIRTTPDITINDYVVGQNLNYQRPESPATDLLIDKGKYFAFSCDDVIKKQSDIALMDDWSEDAGQQMKISIDAQVLATIRNDANAQNMGVAAGVDGDFNLGAAGAPVQLTKDNILDYFVDMGTILDDWNIPDSNRWIVITPRIAGLIKKSDLKDASMTGDGESLMRNGRLGRIDRWTLYSSNNVYKEVDGEKVCYHVLFGHKSALTFASQMTKMETLRAESTFGDLVRGLNVYGFKVIKPISMGKLYCTK